MLAMAPAIIILASRGKASPEALVALPLRGGRPGWRLQPKAARSPLHRRMIGNQRDRCVKQRPRSQFFARIRALPPYRWKTVGQISKGRSTTKDRIARTAFILHGTRRSAASRKTFPIPWPSKAIYPIAMSPVPRIAEKHTRRVRRSRNAPVNRWGCIAVSRMETDLSAASSVTVLLNVRDPSPPSWIRMPPRISGEKIAPYLEAIPKATIKSANPAYDESNIPNSIRAERL